MAYIPITNAQVDPDSPVTAELMTALRDNPIEMFAGAAGAPRVAFSAMGSWLSSANGVGSMVFAARIVGTADVSYGGTIAGSNIAPTSAIRQLVNPASTNTYTLDTGSALSGTWRCLGFLNSTATGSAIGATLFIRIS